LLEVNDQGQMSEKFKHFQLSP